LHPIHTITPRLIDQRFTVFADTTRPILIALYRHTGRLTAFWAHQHYVRDVDRTLELDAAWVNVTTGLGLDLLLMFGANVHTLHYDAAVIQQHVVHFTAIAFILQAADNDFDSIAFTNLDSHS
jgi:hypothetical protein